MFRLKAILSRVERDVCEYFGQLEFIQNFVAGHSRLMGRQFLPMMSSLPCFRIGMIIALCHISGIRPVEIDRLQTLVRKFMASLASFLRWRVLISSDPMTVDDFNNRIACIMSAGVKDGVPVNGIGSCRLN